MALATYRALIRAARIAFEGDKATLTAALRETRTGFESHRTTPAEEAQNLIQNAQEIAHVLRANVVQGRRIAGEEDRFQLRIHEYIERGDNESIKQARGKPMLGGAPAKCSA